METIDWKDTYSFWKMKESLIAPELLESVSFKHIKFKYNDAMHRIYGYD